MFFEWKIIIELNNFAPDIYIFFLGAYKTDFF